jgi:hypothetical protein
LKPERERVREREILGEGGYERRQKNSSALKVPRQYPLVLLLAEVRSTGGKLLGSEEGKVLGSGLCYEQRREVE